MKNQPDGFGCFSLENYTHFNTLAMRFGNVNIQRNSPVQFVPNAVRQTGTPRAVRGITFMEEWKSVYGYEGKYEISNLGRVRGLDRLVDGRPNEPQRRWKGRILKIGIREGYPYVALNHGEKQSIHRLLMAAFVGPSDLWVNHINGIRTDNRLENLEYVTPKENTAHAIRTGLMTPSGEHHPLARLRTAQVLELRRLASLGLLDVHAAAKTLRVAPGHIHGIIRRIYWKHI